MQMWNDYYFISNKLLTLVSSCYYYFLKYFNTTNERAEAPYYRYATEYNIKRYWT